jgi:hypothetical protein
MLHLIAFGLLALLGRGVFVFFAPYRRHRRCGGHGCARCRGTGLKRRLGAYHVHKLKLSLAEAWQDWRARR